MKDVLPGLKTKIVGWVTALAPALAMIGYDYDPAAVGSFIDEFSNQIAGVFVMLGAAIHWFRGMAEK
jgi:hypothetical protein